MIHNIQLVVFLAVIQLLSVACRAQLPGCIDPLANNYDPLATVNDGTCTYDPATILPVKSLLLSDTLAETSGLIFWEGSLWSHNDNSDTLLYSLDTLDAAILSSVALAGVKNTDWEEISQDNEYVYLGDIGNNANGNRTDLHILRINKDSLYIDIPVIDTIAFAYDDQVEFEPTGPNYTDFDCEAFIVTPDCIYLFTKQWISGQTAVYSLPNIPGSHIAEKKAQFNVRGLITGASYKETSGVVVLCGYTALLQPFLYLLYDFDAFRFFSGNKRRVEVSLAFHQVEGITTIDGEHYYISNEYFHNSQFNITTSQQLHLFDLEAFLNSSPVNTNGDQPLIIAKKDLIIFPNPAIGIITIKSAPYLTGAQFTIIDLKGREVLSGRLNFFFTDVDISQFSAGPYLILLSGQKSCRIRFVKN